MSGEAVLEVRDVTRTFMIAGCGSNLKRPLHAGNGGNLRVEAGEVIAEFKSTGLTKGTVLGVRGEQPNALMDSVIDSLEEFLDDEGEDAIKDAR